MLRIDWILDRRRSNALFLMNRIKCFIRVMIVIIHRLLLKAKRSLNHYQRCILIHFIFLFRISGDGTGAKLDLDFSQEVYATRKAIQHLLPESDVVIELGGEDAKILFFNGGMDFCMNGSCAGGTGSFIDQMASLLQVSSKQLNELAKKAQRLYPIASRCGVFAKSDIQPLLNQGARKKISRLPSFDRSFLRPLQG